jgi:hypothetical protein
MTQTSTSSPTSGGPDIVRRFLIGETAAFALASLIHRGHLVAGYEHGHAATAESVIAAVLVAGLVLTWVAPHWMRAIGLAAQGFALFGTLVGVFVIIKGVGPQTGPDIAYHAAMVVMLIVGLVVTARARRGHAAIR